jgi:O-antigen ligase
LEQAVYKYGLLFFALLLPFQPSFPPITLALMFIGVGWLLSGNLRAKFKTLSANRVAIYVLAYFFWCVMGLAYTTNFDEGLQDVGQKIPFLFWPVFLGCVPVAFLQRNTVIKTFLFSLGMCLAYCFGEAFWAYQESGNVLEFHFDKLVESDMVPPHYLGMMLNFGYALLLHGILRGNTRFTRFIDVFLAVFFVVGLIFLSVRMQYLTFLVVNLLVVWRYSKEKRGMLFAWGAMILTLAIFSLAIYSYEGSRRRIVDAIHEAISLNGKVDDKQTNHRKFLWQYGSEVVLENPVLGTGTGAGDDALNEALQQSDDQFWDEGGLYFIRDRVYNYHNVYLQQLATQGTIGLFILLVMLFVPMLGFQITYEARLFITICALSFLTESMFQRQAGILFFSFFYMVLLSPANQHSPDPANKV